MNFVAKVRRVTGKAKYTVATIVDGKLVPLHEIPAPTTLRIEPGNGGFFMLHFDDKGEAIADDWFLTLEEAKKHGEWAFGIPLDGWTEVE